MDNRISDWKNRSLSFAGRLQLVRSVLSSLHIYWASVFILPSQIIKDLEKKMRAFLWCHGPMKKGKAKVSWQSVCLPKWEGGLGIRKVNEVNQALMVTHIWSILTHRESLWVKWIHSYRLNKRNFWDVPIPVNCCWGWRKLLQLRPVVRPYFWSHVGAGNTISIWFDKWCAISPLRDIVSPRDVLRAGLSLSSTLAELMSENGIWKWPEPWFDLFPILNSVPIPQLQLDRPDTLTWRDENGRETTFSSRVVWETIRSKQDHVPWVRAVWYPHGIPRHAFLMWLIVQRKLKTHDKMQVWDTCGNTNLRLQCCSLCKSGPDSHEHLFFVCKLSLQVWQEVKKMADMGEMPNTLEGVLTWLVQRSNSKSARNVIARLIVAASAYFIWGERNKRLFTDKLCPASKLSQLIMSTVRLKLASLRFKESPSTRELLDRWKLPLDADILHS